MSYKWEVYLAIKPSLIKRILQMEMPVSNQAYDSWFSFVWCVLAFGFDIF